MRILRALGNALRLSSGHAERESKDRRWTGAAKRLSMAAVVVLGFSIGAISLAGHPAAPAYRAPRTPDGHPDLNGIWQTMNEANWDLQAHMAKPALALRRGPYGPVPDAKVLYLGAVGSVPPGMGVVDGDGTIPYKPEALAKKKENEDKWLTSDPEIKCFLPGVPRA